MKNEDHEKKVEYKTYEAKPCTAEDFESEIEGEQKTKKKEVWEKFQN